MIFSNCRIYGSALDDGSVSLEKLLLVVAFTIGTILFLLFKDLE